MSAPWRMAAVWLAATCAAVAGAAARAVENPEAAQADSRSCPSGDVDLKLPAGFCASIFADDIGHARHLVMAPNGVLYVNTWSGSYYSNDVPHAGGFLVALQDTTGSGKANINQRFGETARSGGTGGTGIGYFAGALYAEINDRIVRYALPAGSIVPQGAGETVVAGLPRGGDHPMHPFAIDADGMMYVDVATATNSCQHKNRSQRSPGARPCTELKTRGGIWRYDAKKLDQTFSPQERFATGIRNAEGFAIDAAAHQIFVTQHGRDQLHANWPDLYPPEQEATQPAEELLRLEQGGNYGWPACYYDADQGALVLAPEYGGDGGKKRGDCSRKIPPVAAFPAHWAPDGMAFYDRTQFPERYRSGVFIAFHGSWDRAPYGQEGYNVVFQSLAGDKAAGACEIFADGFAGKLKSPEAQHRPTGIAVGLDGALYVSDDVRGRIYRIEYRGQSNASAAGIPCPGASAPPAAVAAAQSEPPEGTHPDAGSSPADASGAELPVPDGATKAQVALGGRIFHGQVGGAACTGCHGANGSGTALGPNLTNRQWLWSDGSLNGIRSTITQGVTHPKNYRAPMLPLGGARLTPEQLSAVAAYVWALSHRSP